MKLLLALCLLAMPAAAAWAGAPLPALPAGESPSPDYHVTINGAEAAVYTAASVHGGNYAFASFDLGAEPATVTITSKQPLEHAIVQLLAADVPVTREPGKLTLQLTHPCQLSLEPNGIESPLLLFANAPEQNPPAQSAASVIYFGPGVHKPGVIMLRSNQTLYLAAGAVVKGAIVVTDAENVRICGRGILDGTDWPWLNGPAGAMLTIANSRNVTVEDVILRGSFAWTLVPRNARHVVVRDVKILNSRVQNDDAIDIVNSQDIAIEHCFVRSDDDCVAIKGLADSREKSTIEDVHISDCVFWCDRARIFLLGHESVAPEMKDIEVRDCAILHFVMTPFLLEPGEEMLLTGVRFQNIRVQAAGQRELIRLRPTVNLYMVLKQPGHIRDVSFSNIQVTGPAPAGGLKVQLFGPDEQHRVENVSFENVTINGDKLTAQSPGLETNAFASGVVFK